MDLASGTCLNIGQETLKSLFHLLTSFNSFRQLLRNMSYLVVFSQRPGNELELCRVALVHGNRDTRKSEVVLSKKLHE